MDQRPREFTAPPEATFTLCTFTLDLQSEDDGEGLSNSDFEAEQDVTTASARKSTDKPTSELTADATSGTTRQPTEGPADATSVGDNDYGG
jgi:hypothetical protein